MDSHALWLNKCTNHFHETDGWCIETLHQILCGIIFVWHSHLQDNVGGAHATYSIGFEHFAIAQACMNMVQYLGYIVDEHGVHVDPLKIQVISDWPAPTTLTELQSFLGLANLYRRFVLGFSHISWALSQVTKGVGRANFVWGKEQQRAFDDLKHHLCWNPLLSLPDL